MGLRTRNSITHLSLTPAPTLFS